MSGFCPDDWHGTTETDLQQKAAGEDYWYWIEGVPASAGGFFSERSSAAYRAERRKEYAIHDAAIAQAKSEGLTFHLLPDAEQNRRMDAAEAAALAAPVSGKGLAGGGNGAGGSGV